MKIKAKPMQGGSGVRKQDPMEPGTYPARVVQILDLGTQPQRPYQGQPKDDAREINLTYEFVDTFCVDEDGKELEDKPRWLSERFPLFSIKSERARAAARYKALDPTSEFVDSDGEGDWGALIGAPCLVTVTYNPKNQKNYVGNVAVMRKKDAEKLPELVNPPKLFSVEDPDLEVLGSLPQWLQDLIKESPEFKASVDVDKLVDADQPAEEGEANEDDGGW